MQLHYYISFVSFWLLTKSSHWLLRRLKHSTFVLWLQGTKIIKQKMFFSKMYCWNEMLLLRNIALLHISLNSYISRVILEFLLYSPAIDAKSHYFTFRGVYSIHSVKFSRLQD